MHGLSWKTLLKWMIWGYHYFWKHPYIFITHSSLMKLPFLSQEFECKLDQKFGQVYLIQLSIGSIGSMYGIFTNIYVWLIFLVNVGRYTSNMDPNTLGRISTSCHTDRGFHTFVPPRPSAVFEKHFHKKHKVAFCTKCPGRSCT